MRHLLEEPPTTGPGPFPSRAGEPDRVRVARVALLLLAVAGLYQGLWAQFAPHSFFEGFPGGMGWIATEGPYNEHLVRDVGGLVNGLSVVAIVASVRPSRAALVAAGLGWVVYAVPHLVFHLVHPVDGTSAQAVNVVVLALEVALPLCALVGATAPRSAR